MGYLKRIRKAIIAGIGAGASAFGVAAQDGQITQADVITIVAAVLVVGYGTWQVSNELDPKVVAAIVHGDKK